MRHLCLPKFDILAHSTQYKLTEMVLWSAQHEETENQQLVRTIQKDKTRFLAAIRQRWVDSTS